jgi:hypothetical protein
MTLFRLLRSLQASQVKPTSSFTAESPESADSKE